MINHSESHTAQRAKAMAYYREADHGDSCMDKGWPGYTHNHETDLLLPAQLSNELHEQSAARRSAFLREAFNNGQEQTEPEAEAEAEAEAEEEPTNETAVSPIHPQKSIQAFDPEAIKNKLAKLKNASRETRENLVHPLEDAMRHEGRRNVLDLEVNDMQRRLLELLEEMPNFRPAIAALIPEIAVAVSGPASGFEVTPILLDGPPGIGKTRFAERLAQALAIPFQAFALGCTQASGEVTGSAAYWSNTRPGRLMSALAADNSATQVVMLDELDKMGSSQQYPIEPALLDLCEHNSSRRFFDQSLEMTMDASRLIIIATCNDSDSISRPLLSRMRLISIASPDYEERLSIVANIFSQYAYLSIEVHECLIDRLAHENINLRGIQQNIRTAFGLALKDGRNCLQESDFPARPVESIRRSIGFLS
jgi:ATP-dependent Lon protease